MIKQYIENKDKKVEYAELVYDLIFIYIARRTIAMLHHSVSGYVTFEAFSVYTICMMTAIQIWVFTVYYINAYGKNSVRDHVFLFSNTFLIFFLGRGAQAEWQNQHLIFHIAWALILLNTAAHYLIERRHHKGDQVHQSRINRTSIILICEAVIVGLAAGEFELFGTSYLTVAALLFGLITPLIAGKNAAVHVIDFEHLSERAMLYVVLTFGEMIIALGGYFDGDITVRSVYFALMAFLIVVALFLSYGVFYDKVINHKMKTAGRVYMLIHLIMIFALNNITLSLEFMRDDSVNLAQKIAILVGSLLLYFAALFAAGRFAEKSRLLSGKFYLLMGVLWWIFAAAMYIFCNHMVINIAVSVAYVFGVLIILKATVRKQARSL